MKRYSLKERLFAMLLSIVMVIGMVPTTVFAVETGLATIETLTDGFTVGESGNNAAEMVFTYAGTPTWSPANPSIGRNEDGWWIGVKVLAPADASETAGYNYGSGEFTLFEGRWDSPAGAEQKYMEFWFLIKPEYLRSANLTDGLSTYTRCFDWNGDGEADQTLVVDIDADQVVLLAEDRATVVYPEAATAYGELVALSAGATVTGSGTAEVKVGFDAPVVVNWVEKDESVGRYQDGWWVGVKLNAPEGMGKEELENVSYKSGKNVKSFWAYRDSTGDGAGQFITMWIPLNGLLSGNMTPYNYAFDWNDDGLFEQTVTIQVDPAMVTLMKNGVQQYPVLGDVKSYHSGASVSGSTTGETSVTISKLSVDWVEADANTGRTQGWWAGIWVEAPVGVSQETLKKAVLQTKKGSGDWSSEISFWSSKDSADTDEIQLIQLWMKLTPAEVKGTENITTTYRFNWDGQGEGDAAYEQYVTFTVVPGEDIVLKKQAQAALVFADADPSNIWIGSETYKNTASGGSGEGEITYAITEGAELADIDVKTGELTLKVGKLGTITVTATKAGDDFYEEQTASYNITTVKKVQEVLFAVSNPTDKVYEAGLTFPNSVAAGVEGVPTYSIVEGEDVATVDAETGLLTVLKAGTVKVKVDMSETDLYNPSSATYDLTIVKGVNTIAFDNAPSIMTWTAEEQPALALKDNLGGEVTWQIVEGGEYATVDAITGKLTLLKAGGAFKLQATAAENDSYNEKSVETEVYVEYANQNWKGFTETEDSVTYGDNENEYQLTVDDGIINTKVTYIVIEGADVATVDADSGKVTILMAGTVKIQASKAGNDQYKADTALFELTIDKAKNPAKLETAEPVVFGTASLKIPVVDVPEGATVTYTIAENIIGATVDGNGVVSFGDAENPVGTAVVTVTVAEDKCYYGTTLNYTIAMDYLQTNAVPTVSGDKLNGAESEWYTGNVKINAPEGYLVSREGNFTSDWTPFVDFTTEGQNLSDAVYLKEITTGHIVAAKTVTGINYDKTAPGALTLTYEKTVLETVLENVTYGIYKTDKLSVTVSASDSNSKLAKIIYKYGDTEETVTLNTAVESSSASFTIPANFRGQISFRVEDVAGNVSEYIDGINLVLDTTNPTIEVGYAFGKGGAREENGVYYTQNDVDVSFAITEANFDLSTQMGMPVVMLDGKAVDVAWNADGKGAYTVSGRGDHELTVAYTDAAGNAMAPYSKLINIDNAKPVIDLSFTAAGNQTVESTEYFGKAPTLQIKITAHNFDAKDVELDLTAKNIKDADVTVADFAAYVKDSKNWSKEENTDKWSLNTEGMTFNVEAIYKLSVRYTDLSGNVAEEKKLSFVYDKTASSAAITYSKPVAERVIDKLTFGFYEETVLVTVTAKDITSGVQDVVLTYTMEDGVSGINTKTFTTEALMVTQGTDENKDTFTVTYEIPAEARGKVHAQVTDLSQNAYTTNPTGEPTLVVDNKDPDRKVTFDGVEKILERQSQMELEKYTEGNDAIIYFKDRAVVKFEITEANFDLSLKNEDDKPVIKVNGEEVTVSWTKGANDVWTASYTIEDDGDYVVTMTYVDLSGNTMTAYTSCPLHVDSAAPIVNVQYTDDNVVRTVDGVKYYKTVQTANVTITEHNFRANDVAVTVTAEDITGAVVGVFDYSAYAKDPDNWTKDGDVWTLKTEGMKFDVDAIYTFHITYTDLSGNVAAVYKTDKFLYDYTCETEDVTITYSKPIAERVIDNVTFGFHKESVQVDVKVIDRTAGVESIVLTYTMEDDVSDVNTKTFTADPLTVTQNTKNKDTFTATYTIPAEARGKVHVQVTDLAGNTCTTNSAEEPTLVVDNITPTRTVSFGGVVNKVDAATLLNVDSYEEGDNTILYFKDEAVVTFEITEASFDLSLANKADQPVIKVNGEEITVSWTKGENDAWTANHTLEENGDYVVTMTYKDLSSNEMVEYTSCQLRVDDAVPVIVVKYTDGAKNKTIDKTAYYKTVQTANVTITEHNFRADDVVLTVTAKDITGTTVGVFDYSAYAKNRDNWTQNGDVWTLKTDGMKFDVDAIYTFDISYKDIVGNAAASYETDHFVYDSVSDADDVAITYSTPVAERVIDSVTFDFYKEKVLVTVTAKDITAGVQDVVLTYTVEDGVSDVNTKTFTTEPIKVTQDKENKDTFVATYEIPARARGTVVAKVTDHSGNFCDTEETVQPTLVVDNITPTRTVSFGGVVKKVDAATLLDVDNYEEGDNTILYFKEEAVVTFKITEANFDLSLVNKADQPVIKVNGKKIDVNWTEGADDVWTANHTLEENGDYVVTMTYKDLSSNEMAEYTSCQLRVDDAAPVMSVVFNDGAPTQTIEGTDYYKTVQTAHITITEHNFRADDVKLEVTAKNIKGDKVEIADYSAYAKNRDNWTQNGDVWTLKTEGMKFDVEAIYTFELNYTDLSTNAAETWSESFVYDCTAKVEDISITYSEPVLSEVLNDITFGYYKDDVVVTVTVKDITAGIETVDLTYTLEEGASEINTKTFTIEDIIAIQNAENKDTFTISYTIPAQAKGRVNVDVLDFCGNTSTSDPAKEPVLVVDNIAPTATVRYNAPVQTANNISYYNGNINVTIEVTEANFFADDVQVSYTRNGANVTPHVNWNSISVDNHVGTFTLTEEGNYIITINYTDRSGNGMATYTSNQLTLDTTAPTIKVSNIKANSANKDETYGFVIEMSDINLDVASMKPVLKAVVQENGAYKTKEIDLGTATTVVAGQTYTYTVENLPEDGLYTLTCEVKDMSSNTTDEIELEDAKLYEQVQFSINRKGSAFGYGNTFTENLNTQYYVYSVDEDVVLVEVNVDPIENYTVKLNGKELAEKTDYVTEQTSNAGEWSKRTYRINKSLFEAEGEYNIIITSTDKATTTAYSDIKNLTMAFVVDQTKPVLTITGLTTGGRYQTDAQTVTLIPTDEGGRLQSLKVTVLDSDGQPLTDDANTDISVRFEMSGDEMLQFLAENDGKITFTIPEGLNNQVRIVCSDCAVNAENETNTYDELFTRVTVSQNQLIIFYANKTAFYGTIGGVLAALALVVVLINRKKRAKA